MKTIQMICVIFIGCLLVSFSGVEMFSDQPSEPNALDFSLEGDVIYSGYEHSGTAPAVAYSPVTEQYLLVFEGSEKNGVIKGVFIDANTGENLLLFSIFDSPLRAKNPDVAYDSDHDRFFVVYERENEIYGRVIYGGAGHPGGLFPDNKDLKISGESGEVHSDPAVVHNSDDDEYMVVFVQAPRRIMGRMVQAHETTPLPLGTAFTILNYPSGNVYTPDVAWTGMHNSFLAVWHRNRASGADWVHAHYLHDQYSGSPQKYGSVVKVAPHNEGEDPLTDSCGNPSVAFDQKEDNFLVVFTHLEGSGSPVPRSIHGTRLKGRGDQGNPLEGYAFPIETIFNSKNDTHIMPSVGYCGVEDEMHVLYTSADIGAAGGDQYRIIDRIVIGETANSELKVHVGDGDQILQVPAISGTDDGRCLAAWRYQKNSTDWDIAAQRIAAQKFIYSDWKFLPFLVKSP